MNNNNIDFDKMIETIKTLLESGISVFYYYEDKIKRVVCIAPEWIDPLLLAEEPDTEPEPAIKLDDGSWAALYCVDPCELKIIKINYESIKF